MRDKADKLKLKPPGEAAWTITKRQVVCSELARAIRLFICDHDMISAHVLAGAAREIISVAATVTGKPTMRDAMAERIKDEHREAFLGVMNLNYNFMKHGKRDLNAENEHYQPRSTEMLILEACADFYSVYGVDYMEPKLFHIWMVLRYPDMFLPDHVAAMKAVPTGLGNVASPNFVEATAGFSEILRTIDQPDFPEAAMPLLAKAGASGPMRFYPTK